MITKSILDSMPENTIFACGVLPCDNELYTLAIDGDLRWVAKRGIINDWAIYVSVEPDYISTEERKNKTVAELGTKIYGESTIRTLVPCDDEALKLYRY
ncbi:MAG: hypothetical protein WCP46_00470 [Alphaproteobacteria bacterium]